MGPKELSHGIGMSYLQAHLNSFYNNRYTLKIEDEDEFYFALLNIVSDLPKFTHE